MKFIQFRTWTNELEETLEEVQRNMEDACDDYFKKIMNDAIKVGVSVVIIVMIVLTIHCWKHGEILLVQTFVQNFKAYYKGGSKCCAILLNPILAIMCRAKSISPRM